jgi:hypothetical protein
MHCTRGRLRIVQGCPTRDIGPGLAKPGDPSCISLLTALQHAEVTLPFQGQVALAPNWLGLANTGDDQWTDEVIGFAQWRLVPGAGSPIEQTTPTRRGIRPLVAGALGFVIRGQAFVA